MQTGDAPTPASSMHHQQAHLFPQPLRRVGAWARPDARPAAAFVLGGEVTQQHSRSVPCLRDWMEIGNKPVSFLYLGGDHDADETEGAMPASRMPKPRPCRAEVLPRSSERACFGSGEQLQKRIRRAMAQGVEGIPFNASALRGVFAARTIHQSDGRGSHYPTPRRQDAVLGSRKLAGIM